MAFEDRIASTSLACRGRSSTTTARSWIRFRSALARRSSSQTADRPRQTLCDVRRAVDRVQCKIKFMAATSPGAKTVLAPGLVAAINLILHWTRSTARRTSQRVCRGRSAVWLLLLRAKALRKRIQDLAVVVLDRPRHARLVEAIRSSNAMVRMISDGDITAAIAPSIPGSGVDLYTGI